MASNADSDSDVGDSLPPAKWQIRPGDVVLFETYQGRRTYGTITEIQDGTDRIYTRLLIVNASQSPWYLTHFAVFRRNEEGVFSSVNSGYSDLEEFEFVTGILPRNQYLTRHEQFNNVRNSVGRRMQQNAPAGMPVDLARIPDIMGDATANRIDALTSEFMNSVLDKVEQSGRVPYVQDNEFVDPPTTGPPSSSSSSSSSSSDGPGFDISGMAPQQKTSTILRDCLVGTYDVPAEQTLLDHWRRTVERHSGDFTTHKATLDESANFIISLETQGTVQSEVDGRTVVYISPDALYSLDDVNKRSKWFAHLSAPASPAGHSAPDSAPASPSPAGHAARAHRSPSVQHTGYSPKKKRSRSDNMPAPPRQPDEGVPTPPRQPDGGGVPTAPPPAVRRGTTDDMETILNMGLSPMQLQGGDSLLLEEVMSDGEFDNLIGVVLGDEGDDGGPLISCNLFGGHQPPNDAPASTGNEHARQHLPGQNQEAPPPPQSPAGTTGDGRTYADVVQLGATGGTPSASQRGHESRTPGQASYMKMIQLEGSPQAQVGPLFHSLPMTIVNAFKGYKIMPDCCIEVPHGRSIGSDKRLDLTPDEHRVLYERAGFLARHCPIYSKCNSRSELVSKSSLHESVFDMKCKGSQCGCQFQMRIARACVGGRQALVAYQKVDGSGMPIPHSNHELFPFFSAMTTGEKKKKSDKSTSASAPRATKRVTIPQYPNLEQQKYVALNLNREEKNFSWKVFVNRMLDDLSVPSHECQRTKAGKKALIGCLQNWAKKNKQYLYHRKESKKMNTKDVQEILDALRDNPLTAGDTRDTAQPPEGGSNDRTKSYFKSPVWRLLWENLVVAEHNFGERSDGKFSIQVAALHAKEIVEEAVKMYPEDKAVQVDVDFFNLRKVKMKVGQGGITDIMHIYWLTTFVVCNSENLPNAYQLLTGMMDMVEACEGFVQYVLVDGGTALEAAIRNANIRQSEKDQLLARLRACFSHNCRMPSARSTGPRGGRGSFPKHCLDHGMTYGDVAEVMYLLYQFNFLPDRITYKYATELLLKTWSDRFPPAALDHIRNHYLDGDRPELLGGRAVGRQGMCGSTNSMEQYGGHWKNTYYSLAANASADEQKSPLLILEAAATHLSDLDAPHQNFNSKPIRTTDNFKVIRALSKWKRSVTNDGRVFADFAYAQCTQQGNRVNLKHVIGKGRIESYCVHFPSARTLYTLAKQMKLEELEGHEYSTFHEQNLSSHGTKGWDYNSTDSKVWRQIVNSFNTEERAALYQLLAAHFDRNTVEPWKDEEPQSYLDRHAQRLPEDEKAKIALPEKKKKRRRGKKKGKKGAAEELLTLDEKREIQDEEDKWEANEGETMVDLGEEPTMETIVDHLDMLFGMNAEEKQTLKMQKKRQGVRVQRQLGAWGTVSIDSVKQQVRCNCEDCNTWGRCFWVDTFESIEFGVVPPSDLLEPEDAVVGWQNMVAQAVEVIKFTHLNKEEMAGRRVDW